MTISLINAYSLKDNKPINVNGHYENLLKDGTNQERFEFVKLLLDFGMEDKAVKLLRAIPNKLEDTKESLTDSLIAFRILRDLHDDYIKPLADKDYFDVYHIFNIRHQMRDQLRIYLLKNGIKTEIHYPICPHNQEALSNIVRGVYPISELIHKTTLSLPISFVHTEDDIYKIIEILNSYIK